MAQLQKAQLEKLYIKQQRSSAEIALTLRCSEHRVNYWLAQFGIRKRSISQAMYAKHNPNGDPFDIRKPKTIRDAKLSGLGLGLYWGEGTKSSKYAIRLGNTDPKLLKKFIEFLERLYRIKREKLRFGLQIFSDMQPKTMLRFWQKKLRILPRQFQKVIITPARSIGTYRQKTKYGVLTVQYHNKKLRDIICQAIEGME